jgi:hypothetical protein
MKNFKIKYFVIVFIIAFLFAPKLVLSACTSELDCDVGQVCNTSINECEELVECDIDEDCEDASFCFGGTYCQGKYGPGQLCEENNFCLSGVCNDDSGKCEESEPRGVAGVGGTCTQNSDCTSNKCYKEEDEEEGVCEPADVLDQKCVCNITDTHNNGNVTASGVVEFNFIDDDYSYSQIFGEFVRELPDETEEEIDILGVVNSNVEKIEGENSRWYSGIYTPEECENADFSDDIADLVYGIFNINLQCSPIPLSDTQTSQNNVTPPTGAGFILPSSGGGSPTLEPPTSLFNPLGETDVRIILGRVVKAGMGIMGSIVLLVFVYGGFLWLTSAGNQDRVKKGTDTMLWAAIGVFIIFASYAILSTILTALAV